MWSGDSSLPKRWICFTDLSGNIKKQHKAGHSAGIKNMFKLNKKIYLKISVIISFHWQFIFPLFKSPDFKLQSLKWLGLRCETFPDLSSTTAAFSSTEWACKASWSCCRTAACPLSESLWGFSPPDARRKAARWPRTRQCGGKAGGAAASQTCWAGWGTGSLRTPLKRTGISPADPPRGPHLRDHKHLQTERTEGREVKTSGSGTDRISSNILIRSVTTQHRKDRLTSVANLKLNEKWVNYDHHKMKNYQKQTLVIGFEKSLSEVTALIKNIKEETGQRTAVYLVHP